MDYWDDCDGCNKRYDLTKENTKVILFLSVDWPYNHAQTQCPHCGYHTVLAMEPEVLIKMILAVQMSLYLYIEAGDSVKNAFNKALDQTSEQPEQKIPPMPTDIPEAPTNDELPPIPRDWAIQFFNDLREFGKGGEPVA